MNSSTWSARSAASLRRGCWRKVPNITFSRIVSAASGCTTWTVRPMPSRVASYGSPPVMSCPAKRMIPASGFTKPVMRLNTVVFPAPLGPMRKTTSPSSTWKLTSLVASSPPNRLLTFSNSRMRAIASALHRTDGACLPPELRSPHEERDHPAREEDDHHDQQRPVDHQVGVLEVRLEDLRGEGEDDAAEDRSPDRRRPAEHRDERRLDGDLEGEDSVRAHEAEVARVHAPGERRERGTGKQGQQLLPRRIHAHRHRGILVLADGPQPVAEARGVDPRREGEGRPQQRDRPPEELRVQVRGLEEQRGIGAHRTVGELVLVLHQHPDDLRRGD